MEKLNPSCECPSKTCPNRGNCKLCRANHHKWLHTYCRAGKVERLVRRIYARVAGK